MDVILRQASNISVRPRTERVGDSECWVIDAVTPRGGYTLWIDPPHGHNLAKAEVKKKQGDFDRDSLVPKNTSIHSSVLNARFSLVDGLWVPVEAQSTLEVGAPEGRFLAKTWHKINGISLNPDHQNSFALMVIRNGAKVVVAGAPRTPRGHWRDGQIIDFQGNTVDLAQFGYAPLPDWSKR